MSERLGGAATPEGTSAYRARTADQTSPSHFRSWRGLQVSSIGLGTYLGDDTDRDDALYGAAITHALALGCNVLDTAINYRSQRSERAVGAALRAAVEAGAVRRQEVVIATKGGYLPFDGAIPLNPRAYLKSTFVDSGLVGPGELAGGAHCLGPRYIADQIERSRANLGVDTIDIYYLHNPEAQLAEGSRTELLHRLRSAFEVLENAAAAGAIGVYGTATWNGYRQPPQGPDHLPLEEILAVATEVGGHDHKLRVIQLPYNLAMPEALLRRTQPSGGRLLSALDAAREQGLYVMASASILQGRLTRGLPSALAALVPDLTTDAQRALQVVRSTPGVGTALVGMKRVEHVDENLAVARLAPAAPDLPARLLAPSPGAP